MIWEDEELAFTAGQSAVVPAGVRHEFEYPECGVVRLCIWFEVQDHPAADDVWVIDSPGTPADVIRLMAEVFPSDASADANQRVVAEHLLGAFLVAKIDLERVDARTTLRQRIELLVHERGGQPLTVEEAAEAVGYSASRLAAKVREEAGTTTKAIIDQARLSIARQRLRYSDESIGEIALALGFPDIYSFSHCFKRVAGQSPTDCRAGV